MCCLLYIFELYIFFACFGFLCSTFCVINMNHVFHLAHYKMHVRRSLLGIGQCRELECIGALKRRRAGELGLHGIMTLSQKQAVAKHRDQLAFVSTWSSSGLCIHV